MPPAAKIRRKGRTVSPQQIRNLLIGYYRVITTTNAWGEANGSDVQDLVEAIEGQLLATLAGSTEITELVRGEIASDISALSQQGLNEYAQAFRSERYARSTTEKIVSEQTANLGGSRDYMVPF